MTSDDQVLDSVSGTMARKSPPDRGSVICLMGPTASGKTDLAVSLTERLPCDIVSVDSALIYKGMDIGTAKPDAELLARAPHRLIDIIDPAQVYSVAEFRQDCLREINDIIRKGRIPLLVGGTMMYFKALLQGIAPLPPADEATRQRLLQEAARDGWSALYQRLLKIDPQAARGMHENNHQRLLRALEVYEISGKPISALWAAETSGQSSGHITEELPNDNSAGQLATSNYTKWEEESFGGLPYNVVNLAVSPKQRSDLHARIALRFNMMLEAGFIDEVKALYEREDLNLSLPSMRCVGYRQAWEYLDGHHTYEIMIEKGVAATRQLAKRQLTWLRGWPELRWFYTEDEKLLDNVLDTIRLSLPIT
ncbi:tRNA (adenosine(37)-N6)-dimethylallyltransferase MiaA [Oleiphilus messinensis]|uniref:tRNA (adenosine(37)-N6)-dimethylallyltransferase MiaA n=1 Tax=Oleiphilus messinensis TaxID=141451 RepID=UPI0026A3432E